MAGLDKLQGKTRIIAMTLNQAGAADIAELIDHVQRLGGYLACNLPDNRLYFLQDAELAGPCPYDQTAPKIVATTPRRPRPQFAPQLPYHIHKYPPSSSPPRPEPKPTPPIVATT